MKKSHNIPLKHTEQEPFMELSFTVNLLETFIIFHFLIQFHTE